MWKSIVVLAVSGYLMALSSVGYAAETKQADIDEGKRLTLENCQSCHQYEGTDQAGTVGPPFSGMKARFSDRKKLYDIIYDAQAALRKDTMMPPFGRNELLAKDEIEKIIDFLYTL
jgi:sulfur-oxidizing protein SoxX